MRQQKGFTLIELLVVIAIIAILASLAIPQYLSYQRKAKVSSYAQPLARACLMDLVAYCIENPNATINTVVGPTSPARNCRTNINIPTAGGLVNISSSATSVTCGLDGSLEFGTATSGGITAVISSVSDYQARCFATSNSTRCTVEPR